MKAFSTSGFANLLVLTVVLILSGNQIRGQEAVASFAELVQTSHLIFTGTVIDQTCRWNDKNTMIFTDVIFKNIYIVYSSERSVQKNKAKIKVTYAGGRIGDFGISVSEVPGFETGNKYLVFLLDDGKTYMSPVVGGSQGLYEIITDEETGYEYVTASGKKLVVGLNTEKLVKSNSRIQTVTDGIPVYEENKNKQDFKIAKAPAPNNSGSSGKLSVLPDYDHLFPVQLSEMINFIKNEALTASLINRVFRICNEQGRFFQRNNNGDIESYPIIIKQQQEKSSGFDKLLNNKEQAQTPQPKEKPGKESQQVNNQNTVKSLMGQGLVYCGHQDLPINMQALPQSFYAYQVPFTCMGIWNAFQPVYTVFGYDGSIGNNYESEFAAWMDNFTLNLMYGFQFGTALAICISYTMWGSCGWIYESDVVWNYAYDWTDDFTVSLGNANIVNIVPVTLHETGHTWGEQRVEPEEYNYDYPSVMHAYYHFLVENGMDIHAVDAYLFRDDYSNQVAPNQLCDLGIESYYASNGLNNSDFNTGVNYYPGSTITLNNVTVENMSDFTVYNTNIRFYLSTDLNLTTVYQLGENYDAEWTFPSFGAEGVNVSNYTTTIPEVPSGTYYISAQVFHDNGFDDFPGNNVTFFYNTINILPHPAWCSGTTNLYNPTGTFTDGSGAYNYGNNSDCWWVINQAPNTTVTLSFTSFSTEWINDYVDVIDSDGSTLLAHLSGNAINTSVTSSGSIMFVYFSTNGSVTSTGWAAEYSTSFCTGTKTIINSEGIIEDGSGNYNYGINSDCYWLIQPAGATSIFISSGYFNTEAGYDFVRIYDGATTSSPLLGEYSGTVNPFYLASSGGSILIHFLTDGSITYSGWQLHFQASFCEGTTNLTVLSGTFSDGSGNYNYGNLTECYWLLQPPGATAVYLDFNYFNTENIYDVVSIYDGTTTSAPLLGSFSGSNVPGSVTSTGGSMLIRFYSDNSITAQGWSACYTGLFCNGSTTFTNSSGSFSDGSGFDNYGNNTNCYWLIQPANAVVITLTFNSFATESLCDYVRVYDGVTTSAPVLATFYGHVLSPAITSTGNAMLVEFITDESVTDQGWNASYTSSPCYCWGTQVLNSSAATFSDGSGNNNYSNNSDCYWLIHPPYAANITLSFSSFNTELNHDRVYIYDGQTTSSILLGNFTGSTIPDTITSSGGYMLIRFFSDGSVTAPGWTASYSSVVNFCSGTTTLTGNSGTLNDGSGNNNYGNFSDCYWLIQPPGAVTISLTFNSFSTEQSYDRVWVYDGADISSPLLGVYSGSLIPGTIYSTGGSLLVHFTTDATNTAAGWSASYTSSSTYCSDTTVLISMTASFNDGSGNNNYSNFSDCYWLIQPPNAVLIILNFDSFSTEPSYDRVWIYDGPTTNDPLLGVFSGNSVPPEITSSGGVLLVHFTSDMSVTAAGWSATYSASTTYCYGTTILTTGSGSFNDGSGSQNYANFSDCYWLIQPPFATTITIGFNSFSTEPVYDKVWIYDGPSVSSTLLGVFSGTTIPSEITSSGGTMLVRFTSDATNTFAGWSAYYTSAISYCSGTVVLTSPTGAFDDGSGNNNYSNNSYCYWLIEPPGAVAITLSFVSFVTEAGYDYVEIYDGSDNYAPLLGHFTGSSLPGEVTSSGGSMLVYFHSDNSLTFAGWAAEYYSNFCSGTDTLTSASGNLTDGSGIYNYGNNSDCYWLIQSPGAVSVTLVFSSFWTETGYDYVNVYDGNNILSPLIGSFSGFSTPDTITSVNGSIFIWFHSDYAENRPGWEAEYSSVSATVPIAGFIADNSVVCAGSFISFTNLTAGLNVNYSWSFGDGYFSNEQNPSHLYFDPGVYTIQLIASNIAGSDTLTIIDYIVVMPSSVVSITIFANPSDQICEGTNVTFNAISSNTGSFPVYQWTVNHENVGTNAPEYSGSELLDGDMVMCEVMSDIECAWDNPAMSNTIFMMVYPLPMINITTTPSTCNICANGSIELSVTGGSGNYIYIWSDGSTEQDIDSLISGLYIVTVIDENGCTGTEQDSVTVQTLDSQILDLVAGWSFFSTYINPVNPDINQILNSVISHVIIVKDGNGNVFWPQYNVNNIGNITTGKGYQLKMDTLQMIIVNGIMIIPENTPLFLNAGWDIIAYLRQSQANIETMMSPVISNIIIMKDGDGYVYWPQYGVNNIVNMQPGKGYQIKTSGACILTYPSNSEVFEKSENNTPQTLHFPKPNNTGNNMTLGVGHGAWSTGHGAWNMKPGDEIGIYTEAAVLAGAAVYSNVFTVITVWGDDELTPEKDGLEPGEMFIIKIWDGSTVKVLEDFIWEYGDQYYEPDKLCVIKDFTGFVSDEIMLFQNVPNPFDDQTVIGFYLPVSTYAELCVYNVLGEKIETLESGYLKDGVHRTIYKIKQIPVGTYIYRLTTNEEIHTGVMIHLR